MPGAHRITTPRSLGLHQVYPTNGEAADDASIESVCIYPPLRKSLILIVSSRSMAWAPSRRGLGGTKGREQG
jgi:hypothetical protein